MKEQIQKDIVTAMKEKNLIAKDILRVVKGEIERNEQTSKGKVELSNLEITKIIKKLIESINESGEDKGEIAILEGYLPKQMTEVQITDKVNEIIRENNIDSLKGLGLIMTTFRNEYDGTYDGSTLSIIVKRILS